MKKFLLGVALLSVISLVGCGATATPAADTSDTGTPAVEVTPAPSAVEVTPSDTTTPAADAKVSADGDVDTTKTVK